MTRCRVAGAASFIVLLAAASAQELVYLSSAPGLAVAESLRDGVLARSASGEMQLLWQPSTGRGICLQLRIEGPSGLSVFRDDGSRTTKSVPEDLVMRVGALTRAVLDSAASSFSAEASPSTVATLVLFDGSRWACAKDPVTRSSAGLLGAVVTAAVAFVEAADEVETQLLAMWLEAIAALEQQRTGDASTAAFVAGEVPDSDLRPRFEALGLSPRAQGARPTCSIFTTVAALEFALARAAGSASAARLSVEYCNWAANAATGRRDDGDFFHNALAGFGRFGICREDLLPYTKTFRADEVPLPDALVDAGRTLAAAQRLRIRWIRRIAKAPGLDVAQLADVRATLAAGWPVAAGSGHSRLLVGFRTDAAVDGGGVFLTLDSALHRFAEVPAAFVRDQVYDAFAVDLQP